MENNPERDSILNEELADLKKVAAILSLNLTRVSKLIHHSLVLPNHIENKVEMKNYLLDILRASVVFLHSTLETMLREIVRLKLMFDGDLSRIPLADLSESQDIKHKFSLDEMSKYRGHTINEVIEISVNRYVTNLSFNNTDNIADNLSRINIPQLELRPYYEELNKMMNRRHQIVHEGDMKRGGKTPELEPITGDQINGWIKCTVNFSVAILNLAINTMFLDKVVNRLEAKGIPFDKSEIIQSIRIVYPDILKS